MPSPRPSAGSPLRGRLRRGLQEEKSPRRNMLRGPSTSVAPATGPHLRLSSSPPPETSGTSLRLCCAATASPRHGPSASNPGCADDGPSRPRLPATSTPAPTSPANGYRRLPLPRHAGPTPPTDTPRSSSNHGCAGDGTAPPLLAGDGPSPPQSMYDIRPTAQMPRRRRPFGKRLRRRSAAIPAAHRHHPTPPFSHPLPCNDLRCVTGTRHASPAPSSLVKNGAGPPSPFIVRPLPGAWARPRSRRAPDSSPLWP